MRAVGIHSGAMMAISGKRWSRHSSDTMAHHRHIPLLQVEELYDVIPYNCIPIAVEIVCGAVSLPHYKHPERAFYIFGPEDGTLGTAILGWCKDRIYIPTNGCMNLAATVNVVLYDRLAKSEWTGERPQDLPK